MPEDATFSVQLDPDLRDAFVTEAQATTRSASDIMRDLMAKFVKRQRDKREYDEFLRRKVEKARMSILPDGGYSNEEVEAEFAARRGRPPNPDNV